MDQSMTWIWFLIIGGVAGWIAAKLTRGVGFGLVGNVLVGIMGALVGGFLLRLLGVHAFGVLGALFTATIGAVAFLYAVRLIKAA